MASRSRRADELLAALGVERSELPVEVYDNGLQYVYVVLASEEEVAALKPDLRRLADAPRAFSARTARRLRATLEDADVRARRTALPEDPATGSAAGPLAVHLLRHGLVGSGEEIEISQGAEVGRPSTLFATAWGTPDRIERVEVAGSAVVVARGEFQL